MAYTMTLAIFSISIMALSLAQTFQYSRGWTNGKRGDHSSQVLNGLPGDFGISTSGGQVAGNRIADLAIPCQLQKLKMFLRGNVRSDQLYLLPCEFFGSSGAASASEFEPVKRFRRSSSTPQENNNNY